MISLFVLSLGVSLAGDAVIPSLYHGQWTTDAAACGGEDTNGVHIGASTIEFYEARGVVKSASQGAKGASARVDFRGEGRNWSEAIRLRPVGTKKLELTALGHTAIYDRCAA